MTIIARLIPLLDQLEREMRTQQLWQSTPPEAKALTSTLPFAVDTLDPHEWLQWIFIPRISLAIEQGNVPRGFSLEPYFSEAWKLHDDYLQLLTILQQIDEVCR